MIPSKFASSSLLPVLLICGASLSACQATVENSSAPAALSEPKASSDDSKKSDEASEQKSAEKLALDIEKKERELGLAKLELEIAKQKAAGASAANQAALVSATFEVEKAEQALAHYKEVEAPRKLAGEQLSVDNAKFRLQERQQEQEQMELEYGPHQTDEHAKKTGEIVIWRGRKSIEFTQRRLDLSEQALEQLQTYEIPLETGKLERKLEDKRNALAQATQKAERGELENLLSVTRAENKLDLLEYELGKLREKSAAGDA